MPEKAQKRTLDQLKQRQRLLQIAIFSLVTIMVWVGVSLFRTQRKSSISPELRELAIPLTPTINQEVLTNLEQKRVYSASELQNFPIYKFIVSTTTGNEEVVTIDVEPSPSPTATATPSPTPSPSATPATTPTAETVSSESTDQEAAGTQETQQEPQSSSTDQNNASDQSV